MASRTVFTEVVRLSHVHLKEKKAFKPTDTPAFMVTLMAPQNGVGVISKTGLQFHSNFAAIEQAIKEVCLEEWQFAYDPATIVQMGIQFPPTFKNGNLKLQKDSASNPIPGTIDPVTKGFNLLKVKNESPVGCVGPDAKDIDPSTVYSGCWGKVQVEVSAFTTKSQPPARILSVKLLNVQMAYDDEAFGRGPAQSASQAFAGSVIGNSNIAAGTGQVMAPIGAPAAPMAPAMPTAPATPVYVHTATDATEAQYRSNPAWTTEVLVANGKGRMETPAPVAPVVPVAPALPSAPALLSAPVVPVAPVTPAVPVYVHTATDATEAQYRSNPAWTTEVLVANGKGRMETPATPAVPAAPLAPPALPAAPLTPPAPVAPVVPTAPAIPAVPLTGKVIMKPDSPHSYDVLKANGWNDDQIITAGYATPNFTNPA